MSLPRNVTFWSPIDPASLSWNHFTTCLVISSSLWGDDDVTMTSLTYIFIISLSWILKSVGATINAWELFPLENFFQVWVPVSFCYSIYIRNCESKAHLYFSLIVVWYMISWFLLKVRFSSLLITCGVSLGIFTLTGVPSNALM